LIEIKALAIAAAARCPASSNPARRPSMSTTHPDLSGDSGHNHLKPFLTGFIICAVIAALALFLTGIPH
jgi:hypothetical protein